MLIVLYFLIALAWLALIAEVALYLLRGLGRLFLAIGIGSDFVFLIMLIFILLLI